MHNENPFWIDKVESILHITIPIEYYDQPWDVAHEIILEHGKRELLLSNRVAFVDVAIKSGTDTIDGNNAIVHAARNGHLDIVERFLEDERVNPAAYSNEALAMAATGGHSTVVARLLKNERVKSSKESCPLTVAVINGNLDIVDMLLNDSKIDPGKNESIILASQHNYLNILNRLLQDHRVDPSIRDNYSIEIAAQNGHLSIVERLLHDPRVDVSNDQAIGRAAEYGHLDIVICLSKHSNPGGNLNYAIRHASLNGHIDIVNLLLKDRRVDPSDEDNRAVQWASRKGHLQVVKSLLRDGRVDPTADNNYAILWAAQEQHYYILKELMNDQRIWNTLTPNDRYRIRVMRHQLKALNKTNCLLYSTLEHLDMTDRIPSSITKWLEAKK
jgi:ankyrin repeat protein